MNLYGDKCIDVVEETMSAGCKIYYVCTRVVSDIVMRKAPYSYTALRANNVSRSLTSLTAIECEALSDVVLVCSVSLLGCAQAELDSNS